MTNPENRQPPESREYDKEKWETMKTKVEGVFSVIDQGKAMGVPQDELDKYAYSLVEKGVEWGDAYFVRVFMNKLNLGSEEERAGFIERATQAHGKILVERAKALEEEEEQRSKEEPKRFSISSETTFPELFDMMDLDQDADFWLALDDQFSDHVEEVVDLLTSEEGKTMTVLKFFKDRGYTKSDVEVFLPIKFKRAKKKSSKPSHE